MSHADPLVAMRGADTTEKATRSEHAALAAHRDELLNLVARTTQHEVRWHLAQLLPRLELSEGQSREVVRLLETYLTDPRRVVRVKALHAVADIAAAHPALAGGPGNAPNTA